MLSIAVITIQAILNAIKAVEKVLAHGRWRSSVSSAKFLTARTDQIEVLNVRSTKVISALILI